MRKRVVIIVVCLLLVCAVIALCLYINSTPKQRVLKELSEGEVYYCNDATQEEILLDSSSVEEVLEILEKPWRRYTDDYDIAYYEYLIVKEPKKRIIGIVREEDYLLLFLDEGKWEVDLS